MRDSLRIISQTIVKIVKDEWTSKKNKPGESLVWTCYSNISARALEKGSGRIYERRAERPWFAVFKNCISRSNISVRNLGFKVYIIKAVKLLRANGGCLGARSLRRTWQAAKSRGEGQIPIEPRMSEWGNLHQCSWWALRWIHSLKEGYRGNWNI